MSVSFDFFRNRSEVSSVAGIHVTLSEGVTTLLLFLIYFVVFPQLQQGRMQCCSQKITSWATCSVSVMREQIQDFLMESL